jgi:hypothetical protein
MSNSENTESQSELLSVEGNTLVIASTGNGKTTLMVQKVEAELIAGSAVFIIDGDKMGVGFSGIAAEAPKHPAPRNLFGNQRREVSYVSKMVSSLDAISDLLQSILAEIEKRIDSMIKPEDYDDEFLDEWTRPTANDFNRVSVFITNLNFLHQQQVRQSEKGTAIGKAIIEQNRDRAKVERELLRVLAEAHNVGIHVWLGAQRLVGNEQLTNSLRGHFDTKVILSVRSLPSPYDLHELTDSASAKRITEDLQLIHDGEGQPPVGVATVFTDEGFKHHRWEYRSNDEIVANLQARGVAPTAVYYR